MTIPSTPRKAGPFAGNGVQTQFPFTFKVFAGSDVDVRVVQLGGDEVVAADGTYSVTLNSNQDSSPGGFVTYPLTGLPIDSDVRLTVLGALDYDQPLDLPSGGRFSDVALENELDRIVMQIQQVAEVADRSLKSPATAGTGGVTLPAPDANKAIGWDSTGTTLVNLDPAELSGDQVFATWHTDTFTSSGFPTFTLTYPPASLSSTWAYLDGVAMVPLEDYDVSANSLIFTVAPAIGAEVLVRYGRIVRSEPVGREVYRAVATAGQTLFTLAGGYLAGQNAIAVYVNGLRMESGGVDFTETSPTTVTFTTGLQEGDSVVFVVGTETLGGSTIAWGSVTSKPSTFPPSLHTHVISDVTGLQTALDTKQPTLISGTNIKTINGNTLLGSGDIAIAGGGGSSTASAVAFTPVGSIASTNVQAAIQELDSEKQAALVSGTNIKTVNGTSLLGSGNVVISGSGSVDAAAIAAALTSTSAEKRWVWNTDVPGAVNATANSSIYLQRNASYSAGPSGVASALYIDTFTPTGTHTTFEWGLTSALYSRSIVAGGGESATPQNVAINGTAFRTAGNAPIWAGNFPAYHLLGAYGSGSGEMHGIETSVGGNGADPGEATIGMYVLPQLRSEVAGPGYFEAWTGVLVSNGTGGLSYFRNGITNQAGSVFGYLDRGTHQVAIDLSTSTNSQSAIRIKANDWIALEATNAIKLRYNSSNGFIEFFNGGTRRGYINISSGPDNDLAASGGGAPSNMATTDTAQTFTALKTFTGGISANGILVYDGISMGPTGTIQWGGAMTSISAGSGFASLPANPVGFLKILIDGTERKVPFYV